MSDEPPPAVPVQRQEPPPPQQQQQQTVVQPPPVDAAAAAPAVVGPVATSTAGAPPPPASASPVVPVGATDGPVVPAPAIPAEATAAGALPTAAPVVPPAQPPASEPAAAKVVGTAAGPVGVPPAPVNVAAAVSPPASEPTSAAAASTAGGGAAAPPPADVTAAPTSAAPPPQEVAPPVVESDRPIQSSEPEEDAAATARPAAAPTSTAPAPAPAAAAPAVSVAPPPPVPAVAADAAVEPNETAAAAAEPTAPNVAGAPPVPPAGGNSNNSNVGGGVAPMDVDPPAAIPAATAQAAVPPAAAADNKMEEEAGVKPWPPAPAATAGTAPPAAAQAPTQTAAAPPVVAAAGAPRQPQEQQPDPPRAMAAGAAAAATTAVVAPDKIAAPPPPAEVAAPASASSTEGAGATPSDAPNKPAVAPAQPPQQGGPPGAVMAGGGPPGHQAPPPPPPRGQQQPAPRQRAGAPPPQHPPTSRQQQQQQGQGMPPPPQQQGVPPNVAPVRMQQQQQQGGGGPRGPPPPPPAQQQHRGGPPMQQQHPPGPSAAGSGAAVVAAGAGGGGGQQHQGGGPGGPPPGAGPPGQGGGGGMGQMRELKVEDALLYLDQVKLEFGDRPRIYNEFLEIMKNFKAQEIDTPGVIRRVSTLFRGYNNLILGFNTFLPEGYKIELKDLEVGGVAGPPLPAPPGPPPPPPPGARGGGPGGPPGGAPGQPMYGQGGPGMGRGGGQPPPQQQQQQQPFGRGAGGAGSASAPPGGGARGPPGGGMPPPGFQQGRAQGAPQQQQQQQGRPPPMQQPGQGQQMPPQQQQQGQPMAGGQPPPQQMQQQQQQQQQQQGGPGHAVEFDHAITYVTTIKKRFANDPRTYQTFLEILHTYQKEQRGIKEVLEQVSNLFADHPDLLKEFTFFLPDAVQEQAKERLARAAAEAEERRRQVQILQARQQQAQAQAAAAAQQYAQEGGGLAAGGIKGGKAAGRGGRGVVGKEGGVEYMMGQRSPPPPPPGTQKFIDMTAPQGKASPGQMRKRALDGTIQPVVPLHPPQPAELVYNAGVERQFFDAAKEALTSYSRDGGQAWAEFLKCLDMYAQEVLSRSEMLGFVEPLLGKRNTELFEEFKRILASAGAPNAPIHDDAWHSVPLSEIDFSRCRRCSPSYRALPRDYPAPPCSERSEMETRVLNDIWVSLPVGSEESYTFRHMRKNQFEEVLFRCEDERFEIDMAIDSNAATLRRLEPIAEEIAQLSVRELATPNLAESERTSGKKGGKDKAASSVTGGIGGKRFQYRLERRVLNTIHKHSIMRLYGDAGEEMFDLLFKNPTMAVPVVVKRLRQKEREWKAARDVLNLRWKELAEVNYYKSLDHQSLTWRTTDKRATSTRTLVAEIKDRAANNGDEGDAAMAARKDKMKEEYGSFYDVTMGRYTPKKLNLAELPKPAKPLFTPHLSLIYEQNSWAQRDAYRILVFALERGSISPMDKERCHRLWRDFLGHLFGLGMAWMQNPAISYASTPHSAPTVVSNGEESGDDDSSKSGDENEIEGDVVVTEEVLKDDNKDGGDAGDDGDFDGMSFVLDQQPIPVGAQVSTAYGEGTVTKFRKADRIYEISFPYGATAYLRPDAILCTIFPVDKSSLTEQLRAADQDDLKGPNDKLIIGTQSLYLFFRLHHVLTRRLAIAKDLAYKASKDRSIRTHIEQMIADGPEDIGRKRYDAFLSLVYGLIEGAYSSQGAAEGGKYEDRVRCLLGQGSYELATMDKLISHIQKHLQNMASDEGMTSLVDVYRRHVEAGSFKPGAFRQEAAYLSEGDNMYAFQYCPLSGTDKSVMHYEFLGDIAESDENSIEGASKKDGPLDTVMDEGAAENSEPQMSKRQRRA